MLVEARLRVWYNQLGIPELHGNAQGSQFEFVEIHLYGIYCAESDPFPPKQVLPKLKEQNIYVNRYAEQFFVLSGLHCSPEQAVVVLSDRIEADDFFPRRLYLHNVDGNLWLRGYVCDSTYRYSGDDLFAFEKRTY